MEQQTLLIQTDFQPASLDALTAFLHFRKNEQTKIIFVHGLILPDSIIDLLFFDAQEWINKQQSTAFLGKLLSIQETFKDSIVDIQFEVFTGGSLVQFKEFIHVNKVNRILIQYGYQFNWKVKNWRDLIPYCRKLEVKKMEISSDVQTSFSPAFSAGL